MNEKKIEPTAAMVDEAANAVSMEEMDTPLHLRSDLARQNLRNKARTALRAALNHPDAPGLIADDDARPWEPLNGPVRVGDEVRRDHCGIITTGVVARVDEDGDPLTADGYLIGLRDYGTWHVRRVAPELPTKCGTVIVANDGHKFIKAEVDGFAHRAREAVLGANGWWYGAWRKAEGDGLLSAMFPEHISAPTWKVDDQ